MPLREWVRFPSTWIERGGLKDLRWGAGGANNTAALMVLMVIAHHAEDATGLATLTYNRLCTATDLSRAKVAGGLDVLERIDVVRRAPAGRSTLQLVDYDPKRDWCKLPARKLYDAGRVAAFKDFRLRRASELDALKLYLLFAARRGRDTNMAHLSYDKIYDYSRVPENRIKTAISYLAVIPLIYVEHLRSAARPGALFNAYRLVGLDTRVHMGTLGAALLRDGSFPISQVE
jgi:hypothetical protein